jgi:hypothetical protein
MNSDEQSEKGYVDEAVLANKIDSLEAEPSALGSATLPVSGGKERKKIWLTCLIRS